MSGASRSTQNPVAVVRKPYDFTEAWEDARRRAGLEGLRFHDLRHEAVSCLVEGGLSDQEVASISGHRRMQMLRRYMHMRAENLIARLDTIEPTQKRKRSRRTRWIRPAPAGHVRRRGA